MTSPTNREAFTLMLNALGRKDYVTFQRFLHPQVLCEWPYRVLEGFPVEMAGAQRLRDALETSLATFTPYAYTIEEVHDLSDPNRLIAEYTSHSTYLPRDVPYSNRYISVIEFANGLITRWREYVNPLVVLEVLGPGFRWEEGKGAQSSDSN